MDNEFSQSGVRAQRILKTAILSLSFGLFLALAVPHSVAQELTFLSKQGELPIIQMFYPDRNETAIIAPTGIIGKSATLFAGPSSVPPPPRNLDLWEVKYMYPGRNRVRPQEISFNFFINQGKDRYKEKQSFSVSGDDTIVHQGELVLEQRDFSGGKKPVTRNMLVAVVPTEVFLRISRAKKVELKLGRETFKLNGDQRKHIRALAETIEP